MSEFAKMDIFFFVTTVAVIALSIVVFFIGLKIWRILGHVERIMEIAAHETELIKEDIDGLRADIRQGGFRIMSLAHFVRKVASAFGKRSRRRKESDGV